MASKNYLTPGQYEALTEKQNRNLRVGMWNTDREDKRRAMIEELARQDAMQQKAARAAAIKGLFSLGGALIGAGGGWEPARPVVPREVLRANFLTANRKVRYILAGRCLALASQRLSLPTRSRQLL